MNHKSPPLPWLLVAVPAALMVVLTLSLSVETGWRSNIEYLDIVAELVLLGILLKWVQTAAVLKRQQRTYWVFFSGNACLIWLMCLKLVGEVSLYDALWLQMTESIVAIAGVILLSFGIAAWSRDYQTLISETEEKKNQYKQLSLTDALTGLPNRSAYNQKIEWLTTRSLRYVLMLVDLDHFKQVNDNHGHDAGDAALTHVAQLLRANCRSQEDGFRIGGEEFAILISDCSLTQAEAIAERIRRAVELTPVVWQNTEIVCTVSIGLYLSQMGEGAQTTYRHADMALYQAKQQGRNSVVIAS